MDEREKGMRNCEPYWLLSSQNMAGEKLDGWAGALLPRNRIESGFGLHDGREFLDTGEKRYSEENKT